jgi:hypothetical protein
MVNFNTNTTARRRDRFQIVDEEWNMVSSGNNSAIDGFIPGALTRRFNFKADAANMTQR